MARYIYQGVWKDQSGNVVKDGRVRVFLRDGLTEAKFYETEVGSTASNNYVESGSDGHFIFWVDTDDYASSQRFKIILQKTDYTQKEYDDIVIYPTAASSTDVDHDLLNNLEWSNAGHSIDTTVNFDGNDAINLGIGAGSTGHDDFGDFVANEHTDHTSVNINSCGILTGGGDITATRNLYVSSTTVDHDVTTNFDANDHIDHTGVTFTASTGLTGGGNISTNRTFAMDILGISSTGSPSSTDMFVYQNNGGFVRTTLDAISSALGSGTTDHSALGKLNWAAAGHTMDATLDMVVNDISKVGDVYLIAGKKLIFDGAS